MSHSLFEEEDFPEPKDSDNESCGDGDEEEQGKGKGSEGDDDDKDLVVIDDEFLQQLSQDIEKGNPTKLAQGVDVILGALGLKDQIIFDEENTINPLLTILVPLVSKVFSIYEESIGKSANKRKITEKMLTDIVQVFDSFDKFKEKSALLKVYCETVYITRTFVDKDDVSKALSKAAKLGLSKESTTNVILEIFEKFVVDPKFAGMVFKLRYVEFTNAVNKSHDDAIDRLLGSLVDFYMQQEAKARSFVKSILQNQASQLADGMSKTDKTIFTWQTIGLVEFVSSFIIKSNSECFVFPAITNFFVYLRNFAIANNLPFQIRVAQAIASMASHFNKVVPLMSWAVDAVAVICSFHCKGTGRFDWGLELESPPHATFEFAEEAFDKLSRIIMNQLIEQSENIAFPEYVQYIRKKLEEITTSSKNERLRLKPKGLIKTITEQQDALMKLKKELVWTTRKEQITAWEPSIAQTKTPMKVSAERSRAVEAYAAKTKHTQESKEIVDEKGDTLKTVTADNFMD